MLGDPFCNDNDIPEHFVVLTKRTMAHFCLPPTEEVRYFAPFATVVCLRTPFTKTTDPHKQEGGQHVHVCEVMPYSLFLLLQLWLYDVIGQLKRVLTDLLYFHLS